MSRYWMFARRAQRHACRGGRGPGGRQYRDHRHDLADDRPSAETGKQERAGAELYIQQHGDTVAGKKSR